MEWQWACKKFCGSCALKWRDLLSARMRFSPKVGCCLHRPSNRRCLLSKTKREPQRMLTSIGVWRWRLSEIDFVQPGRWIESCAVTWAVVVGRWRLDFFSQQWASLNALAQQCYFGTCDSASPSERCTTNALPYASSLHSPWVQKSLQARSDARVLSCIQSIHFLPPLVF